MDYKYLLPARFGGSVYNFWNRLIGGPYEKDVVDFYEKHAPYDVSVDIGAYVGYHTRRLARISNRVIAIEPVNDLVNMPDNVEVHKVAVGRKRENKEINIGGNVSPSFIFGGGRNQKMVRVVLLDDIVTEADFLKIDVEGYELEVLEPSSILDSVRHVAIELHNVRNPVTYQVESRDVINHQRGIFKLLKDFRVYAPEIKSCVTLDDVPLIKKDMYHLLCARRG